jgi:hypothetical protein
MERCLRAVLDELDIYAGYSGLKIDKTQAIWIGSDGVIRMRNIANFIDSSWIRRLMQNNPPLNSLFRSTLPATSVDNFHLGGRTLQSVVSKVNNQFWRDVLSAWQKLVQNDNPQNLLQAK